MAEKYQHLKDGHWAATQAGVKTVQRPKRSVTNRIHNGLHPLVPIGIVCLCVLAWNFWATANYLWAFIAMIAIVFGIWVWRRG